jgi:polysaccharide deacetylase family protein (PEP-CTERM system associated)
MNPPLSAVATLPDVRPEAALRRRPSDRVLNAMTIDVEDYFQVSAFEGAVPRSSWATRESRVCASTDRILEMFDDAGVRATFFVLGDVAERFPDLVRRIALQGHEIASHGYEHRLVYSQSPEEFRADVRRARAALEWASGTPVLGYRAPSFSIVQQSMWALDVLIEEGYVYDSSIYPIRHDRYGIPDWSRDIHRVQRSFGSIWEVPGSTVRLGGANLPMGGGGYFRLLPYAWTQWGIRTLNAKERRPAVFYLHPWEIDPEQPRIAAGRMATLRHYRNLHKTEPRLRRLLREFAFGTLSDVLWAFGETAAEVGHGSRLAAEVMSPNR